MAGDRKSLSPRLRFEILERDGFACVYCGASARDARLHVDHLQPVVDGGTNDYWNLFASCAECNLGKSATRARFHVGHYRATLAAAQSVRLLRGLRDRFPWDLDRDLRDFFTYHTLKLDHYVERLAWLLPDPENPKLWSKSLSDFMTDEFERWTGWLLKHADEPDVLGPVFYSLAQSLRADTEAQAN